VQFVARDRCDELISSDELDKLYQRLKEVYPGFVDLGLIDRQGIQLSYAGPYDLEGYDYSQQQWFIEALEKDTYISNVFLGYRQVPHFVVAVQIRNGENDVPLMLRATIDAETLHNFISRINTKADDDIFIIDDEGILQTSSAYFGKTLEKFTRLSSMTEDELTSSLTAGDKKILQVSVKLQNTPWTLVITKKGYVHGEEWSSFRKKLLAIILFSSVVSLLVIFYLVRTLTNHIKNADIKRQILLAEAEHSSKLASIGRLAAGVAHEINNPLAIIDQKAGLIQDLLEVSDDFQHKNKLIESVSGILNAVLRCKVITHRLLGFARKMDVMLEDIDINELLREVLSFLENIINNAIDAVGRDGIISISTDMHDSNFIRVSIKDNGPGIAPEAIQHIFDPFYTTKETGKGTGLGLSITYGLAKQLGGQIKVSSTLGKGATFDVILPIQPIQQEEEKNGDNQNADR